MVQLGCLTGAVAYLHENKIRHRDVKSSNILLARDGVWITDFGAAKEFTPDITSTSESRERDILRYCAPEEVVTYQESDQSADIFSLGCVLLEMVVGLSHSHTLSKLEALHPLKNQSYQANLDHTEQWLALANHLGTKTQHLLYEIRQMLNHERAMRPKAKALALCLASIAQYNDNQQTGWLHGSCCDSWFEGELKMYKEKIGKLEDKERKNQK
jgi:serine/threonine protein kinase